MDKELNILLLGETGVGKSTFINSFINYLHYETLEEALKRKLFCEIPTSFAITDDELNVKEIKIGNNADKNENTKIGHSSTQAPRTYEFPLKNKLIHLIDTPGIGDSRGTEFDKQNFEEILNHLNNFDKMHAICFLLKPDADVINPFFKFCITTLLSRLEKSSADNIIFVFTKTRSTSYRPGQTLPNIRGILSEIKNRRPYVDVPCNKENIFCMDNEAFRFLVALKNDIQFKEDEIKDFDKSWQKSSKICWELIKYISTLNPHDVKATIEINKARMAVLLLFKPISEMSAFIEITIKDIKNTENSIQDADISISKLQRCLKKTLPNIRIIELPSSVLCCHSEKCRKIYNVKGVDTFDYKTCVNSENMYRWWKIINAIYLWNILSPLGGPCEHCNCYLKFHEVSSYKTEYFESEEEDEDVKLDIKTEEQKAKLIKDKLQQLKEDKEELNDIQSKMNNSIVKLVYFLQENAILPFDDAYGAYLDTLIECEMGVLTDRAKHLKEIKKEYEQEKKLFKEAAQKEILIKSTLDINKIIEGLYDLPRVGDCLKKSHLLQINTSEKYERTGVKQVFIACISSTVKKIKFW